jgi:hypothetical protein
MRESVLIRRSSAINSAAEPGPVLSTLIDPRWPASLSLLLGPAAPELLGVAVGEYGGRLRAVRVAAVGVQPDGAGTAQYDAEVERADSRVTREALAATTGSRIPDGGAVLAAGGVEVGSGAGRRIRRSPRSPPWPSRSGSPPVHSTTSGAWPCGRTARAAAPSCGSTGTGPGATPR